MTGKPAKLVQNGLEGVGLVGRNLLAELLEMSAELGEGERGANVDALAGNTEL